MRPSPYLTPDRIGVDGYGDSGVTKAAHVHIAGDRDSLSQLLGQDSTYPTEARQMLFQNVRIKSTEHRE